MSDSQQNDRRAGVVLGLAVGDALFGRVDAEWMFGKFRQHLTPDLDRGFLMDGNRTSPNTVQLSHLGSGPRVAPASRR